MIKDLYTMYKECLKEAEAINPYNVGVEYEEDWRIQRLRDEYGGYLDDDNINLYNPEFEWYFDGEGITFTINFDKCKADVLMWD